MDSKLVKLASYKQIAGIAVAAIILTVIFVPFQQVDAYTVDLTFPNTSTSSVAISTAGTDFKVTVKPAAGELVSVSQIELILDNGQSSVQRTIFDSGGQRVSGSTSLVKGSLTVTIPTPSIYGYGYGFGLVSAGTTFSSPYSYAFSYSYAFISGNMADYSHVVGTSVNGFVGDGTQEITIQGKINTSLLSAGTHTLDVLINTGTGVSPDRVVAPQLSFTTVADSSNPVTTTTISTGANQQATTSVSGVGDVTIKFGNVASGGTIAVQKPTTSSLSSTYTNIFTSTANATPQFTVGTGTFAAVGDIIDIDISAISFTGSITLTIPYNPANLPGGFNESNLKLMHFNTSTNTWSDITVSVDTVAKTITGTLTSLSPVAVGVQVTTTTTTTTGTSSAGGGGTAVDLTPTLPDSYFVTFPLKKVQVQSAGVVDVQGNVVTSVKAGQQVSISSTFKNFQERSQAFAYIVQVVDSNGFTVDLGWQTGTLSSGQTAQVSRSLTVTESGAYTIKVFVWNDVSASPVPLSEVTTRALAVT